MVSKASKAVPPPCLSLSDNLAKAARYAMLSLSGTNIGMMTGSFSNTVVLTLRLVHT